MTRRGGSRAARYASGQGVALVGAGSWAVLDAAPADEVVELLWSRMEAGADVVELAAILARDLPRVPSFALVAPGGDTLRVVVRGEAEAELRHKVEAPRRLDARDVCTWAESGIGDCDEVHLVLRDAVAGEPTFPTTSGIVLASRLEILVAGADAPAAAASLPRDSRNGVIEPSAGHVPAPVAAALTGRVAGPPDVSVTKADFLLGGGDAGEPATTSSQTPEPEVAVPVRGDTRADREVRQGEDPLLTQARQRPGGAGGGALIATVPWGAEPAEAGEATADVPAPDDDVADRTVRRDDLAVPPRREAAAPDALTPMVHAVRCPDGHLNAPHSERCRSCAVVLPEQDAVAVPRPALGLLRLSSGDDVTLDRDVVIGRRPRAADEGTHRPHLVKVNNPTYDVSRNHVGVVLDGWHVLVKDLGSTNGTLLRVPGQEPQRLRADELVPLTPGSEVTLAEGVWFRYEVES